VKRRSGLITSPFVLLLAVLAAVAVILVPAGSASPGGTYTANLCDVLVSGVCPEGATTPPALPGGSTTFYLSLHNTSLSDQLDSATIGVPTGVTNALFAYDDASISTAGSASVTATQVTLSGLAVLPGDTVTVELKVTACTSGTYDWGGTVIGVDNFTLDNTTPSDNSLTASLATAKQCHLAFVSGQPQDTVKNLKITDDLYSSGGDLKIGLFDSGDHPVSFDGACPSGPGCVSVDFSGGDASAALSGTKKQALVVVDGVSGSVASFGDLSLNKNNSAPGTPDYKLDFTLAGATEGSSDGFSIVDAGKKCPGGSCSLPANFGATGDNSTTTSNVSTSFTTAGGLSLAFFTSALPADVTGVAGGCKGFVPTTSAGVTLEIHGTTGTAFITFGLSDQALKARFGPNYGQKNVPLCLGAQRVNSSGTPIPCDAPDGAGGPAWTGKELDSIGLVASGKFRAAVCDLTTHLWWAIAPNFQDKLPKNTALEPLSIMISAWGSTVASDGTTLRTFTVKKPNPWDFNGRG
jgi:hypothetical protein